MGGPHVGSPQREAAGSAGRGGRGTRVINAQNVAACAPLRSAAGSKETGFFGQTHSSFSASLPFHTHASTHTGTAGMQVGFGSAGSSVSLEGDVSVFNNGLYTLLT